MRWIKHLSMSHADEMIGEILETHGPEAYGIWWLILEDISAPMEPGRMEPSACHSIVKWSQICHCSARKFRSIANSLEEKSLIYTQSANERLTISVPNLLKYKDEYAQKSGRTPEQSRERAEREQSRAEGEQKKAKTAPLPPVPISTQKTAPDDTEQRIRKLACEAPNPQDFEPGVQLAVQEIISSVNPEKTLATMEANIPLWWEAMRDGRAKLKTLRWIIPDRDYLRKPREPTAPGKTQRQAHQDAVWDQI